MYIYTCIHIHLYIHMYVHIHIYIYMYTYIFYGCTDIYTVIIHLYTCIHIHIYIHIYMDIHIHTYLHIYVYVFTIVRSLLQKRPICMGLFAHRIIDAQEIDPSHLWWAIKDPVFLGCFVANLFNRIAKELPEVCMCMCMWKRETDWARERNTYVHTSYRHPYILTSVHTCTCMNTHMHAHMHSTYLVRLVSATSCSLAAACLVSFLL